MVLLKHELVGVNLKEEGRASKFCIFRVLKFARGSGRELKGVDMNSRERNQWWFWGQLYLPTREVCPGKGHIFSWVTEETVGEWEIQLYERNKELVETDRKFWLPVSGVTSARPQVYHPTKLRERRVSISGNPQSYVVFYKGKRRGEEWKLEELAVDEVISLPEDVLGMGFTSLTAVSRNCVSRVTRKVREMMAKGNNQRRVQGTAEGYSRTEWGIYLDMTVCDARISLLQWETVRGGKRKFFDGGFVYCQLESETEQQVVRYEGRSELTLLEKGDCDFALSCLPRGISLGNYAMFPVARGHTVRQCTKLVVKFVCEKRESVGKVVLVATYKDILYDTSQFCNFLRVPAPPPEVPPSVRPPTSSRPPPEERQERVTTAGKAWSENLAKRNRRVVLQTDDGIGLVGKTFYDEDLGMCEVSRLDKHEGHRVAWYRHKADEDGDEESFSSVVEVRNWCNND
jgi:hypothetical protein